AREEFARLLGRASAAELPPTGKTLLLLGEAGSGKTHLMRAFRDATHANGSGYCGYLQMTTRTDSYARYVLGYLIDSLDQPYRSGEPRTGFQRLAAGLLDALDMAPDEDKARLTDDTAIGSDDLGRLVHRLAHLAVQYPRFKGIHADVIRGLLYLLAPDPRVHALAVRWLRCEDLDKFDRELLGDLVPRPGPEMAIKTVWDLGRLMHAVHTAALVLLVDQIEEVVELDLHGPQPGETFRQAVNTLVEVADGLPNAVVVIGCLDNLFDKHEHALPMPKLDRLKRDPDPVRLNGLRSESETRDVVARRLEVLFDALNVSADPANPIAPYTPAMLQPLVRMRSRDILDNLRRHRGQCQAAGGWVPPAWGAVPPSSPPVVCVTWEQRWNDFSAAFKMPFFDEDRLAELLAVSVQQVSHEMPDGVYFGAKADGHRIEVDIHPGGDAVDPLYVAVCDKSTRGGGLGNQIARVAKDVGDTPTVIVRSTEFPTDLKQKACTELAKLVKPKGRGRKVVVSNSDWRAMAAFREFHAKHKAEPGFAAWQKAERPLAELPAVTAILDLNTLLAQRPVSGERPLPPPPVAPSPPPPPVVLKVIADAPVRL
ncbi:MAG: ATP-binding protein, partial [Gemmataceae bacterium]